MCSWSLLIHQPLNLYIDDYTRSSNLRDFFFFFKMLNQSEIEIKFKKNYFFIIYTLLIFPTQFHKMEKMLDEIESWMNILVSRVFNVWYDMWNNVEQYPDRKITMTTTAFYSFAASRFWSICKIQYELRQTLLLYPLLFMVDKTANKTFI